MCNRWCDFFEIFFVRAENEWENGAEGKCGHKERVLGR